jgi:tetratricopeptide (TPR) repeat protein
LVLLTAALVARVSLASSSAGELVRQARAHEDAHEDDVAVRRYMEALTIEPTNAEAWMGLGALRTRLGDGAEADQVYSSALQRIPTLHVALQARARVRWAMGRHRDAEADLETYATLEGSTPAMRELAGWYGIDGRAPAQLAIWRGLLAAAVERYDVDAQREAGLMVRALVVIVDGADPVSSPIGPDATRRALAAISLRGM